ncbi:MAG TPA: RNA polymerase sigma factor [Longimicrobiales bacterium]|nr:RNA polymerase sigma factor [Longimicrobiales bacterium]
MDQLARSAADGDELALARLLAAVRPRVYRWALVHTAAPDDAEDITQQALLRVAAKLAGFTFASRFTTWLYTVTRSAAADWRRTRRRRRDLLALQPPPAQFTEVAPHDDGRLVMLVRAQLGLLPARQRELFDLVDLQGHTPAEAAAMLGMHPGTARVHVLRARRAIRARILAQHPNIVEELA